MIPEADCTTPHTQRSHWLGAKLNPVTLIAPPPPPLETDLMLIEDACALVSTPSIVYTRAGSQGTGPGVSTAGVPDDMTAAELTGFSSISKPRLKR